MKRDRRNTVSSSGAATAPGGYANSGIHLGDVNLHTGAPVRTRYREQVKRIAPRLLIGRDEELAELADFCSAPESAGRYLWWRAKAWSGKSALLSWFALDHPPGIRLVSFFVTGRLAGQNDRRAFIDNVLEQLLTILGEASPPFMTESTREAHLLGLLTDAAEHCRRRNEQLVLIVDGLDEDRGVHDGPDSHSIAALLPAEPPAGMRIVVASRPNPPVPPDVPAHHPLFDGTVIRSLSPSVEGLAAQREMERELKGLLHGTAAEQDLLGLVTAAGGGLSSADLAELTGWSCWEVEDRLRTVTGRTFARRGSHFRTDGPDAVLLGHEQLEVIARKMLGPARVAEYRERIHAWADRFRALNWPAGTPEYLFRGYFRMLGETDDLERMLMHAIDPARQDRVLDLSGGDTVALADITAVQDVLAAAAEPDLVALVRLAVHRDHLLARNRAIPADLPAVRAMLGGHRRAESLAGSFPDPEERVGAFLSVADVLLDAGDREQAEVLRGRAELVARTVSSPDVRAHAMSSVVEAAVRAGALDRAETLAWQITSHSGYLPGLRNVVDALIRSGDVDRAHQVARSIADLGGQAHALGAVAVAWAGEGRFDRAETVAQSASGPGPRAYVLASIAKKLAGLPDQRARAQRTLERAEAAASDAAAFEQVHALARVAEARLAAGAHAQVREVLGRAESVACGASLFEQVQLLRCVAEAWIEVSDVDQAERIVRSMWAPSAETAAIVRLVDASQPDDVPEEGLIRLSMTDGFGHVAALEMVAGGLVKAGEADRAEAFARSISDSFGRNQVTISTATALAECGSPERAAEVLRSVVFVSERTSALELVADRLVRSGSIGRARELAQSAGDTLAQAQVLVSIARSVAATGDCGQAEELLDRGEELARSITDFGDCVDALISVAHHLITAGLRTQADAVLRHAELVVLRIMAPGALEWTVVPLVEALIKLGELARAEALAQMINVPPYEPRATEAVAVSWARAGDLERAEAVALSTGDLGVHVRALASFAEAAFAAGDHDRSVAVLERAELIARSDGDLSELDQRLVRIAEAAANTGEFDLALDLVGTMSEGRGQAEASATVAKAMAEAGALLDAETVSRSIVDPDLRARALISLAAASTGSARLLQEAFAEATELVRTGVDPFTQDELLAASATAIVATGALQLVDDFLQAVPDLGAQVQLVAWVAEESAAVGAREQAVTFLAKARATAGSILDRAKSQQAEKILSAVAINLGDIARAEAAARSASDAVWREATLASVAQAWSKVGEVEHAEEIARALTSSAARCDVLLAVARASPRNRKVRLLAEVMLQASWHTCAPELIRLVPESLDTILAELETVERSTSNRR